LNGNSWTISSATGNVSEFFTIAHTLAETPMLFQIGKRLRGQSADIAARTIQEASLYHDLAAATRTFFIDISNATEIQDGAADIRSVMSDLRSSRDAIVSFKWDEEPELYFSEKGSDAAYTLPDWEASNDFLVLKPHGSIGWYDVAQGIGNDNAYFIAINDDVRLARPDRRIVSYLENELPVDIDGTEHRPLSCPPVIMPRTFARRFDYPELQHIWHDVLEVFRRAHAFVFLGYSLPPDDYLTRAAIRSAMRSSPRERLRCLVVSASVDALTNAKSVFPELTADRNHLLWTFGKGDSALSETIEKRLQNADIVKPRVARRDG
jgi:hypothetical protein